MYDLQQYLQNVYGLQNQFFLSLEIILTDIESYSARVEFSEYEDLHVFMNNLYYNHFLKVLSNPNHLLHDHLKLNHNRRSGRLNTTFKIPRCRLCKRDKTFIYFHMKLYNENT